MLSEQEFRGALERLITAYWSGTEEEWHEAVRLLAIDPSPEQWDEVIRRLRGGGRWTVASAPVARRRALAADRTAS